MRIPLVLFVLALAIFMPEMVTASGSYISRPPRPPSQQAPRGERLDNQKYALGKKVFTAKGKRRAIAGVDARAQAARLRALQKQVPPHAANPNLPALAGTLAEAELEALEYYVSNRHRNAR